MVGMGRLGKIGEDWGRLVCGVEPYIDGMSGVGEWV
jgi:hypothetical protein